MLVQVLALGAILAAVQQPLMFDDNDKRAVVSYWSESSRYHVAPPADFKKKGLWQVRLTVAGSTWLWNFNKARGVSMKPTQDSTGDAERDKVWDAWIDAKVNYDRWVAWQVAQNANMMVTGSVLDIKDAPQEVRFPGPMPFEMAEFCRKPYTTQTGLNTTLNAPPGDPPAFAEAVVPMEHKVKFDDGTELTYQDNCRMRIKYPYYRFDQGVLSAGTPVKSIPDKELDALLKKAGVSAGESRVMKAVSVLEGGFDSVNTYDTGYVSVGFIQFATLKDGAGSLGRMLLDYKTTDPENFQKDFRRFGIDVSPIGVLTCLDWQTGLEVNGPDANKRIIEDKRLIAVFQRAGKVSDAYNAAQIRAAKNQFYPADDNISISIAGVTVTGKVKDFIKTEAGMATLMDRKVNTGKLDPLGTVLQKLLLKYSVSSFQELAKYERQIVTELKYRKDYLKDTSLSQPK